MQDPVEDTKGNNGDAGELLLTNLRLIWRSKSKQRTNISIGYNNITSLAVKPASSRLKGKPTGPGRNTPALHTAQCARWTLL